MTGTAPAVVGILLFPGVEVLDFAGPFEVFSVAARIAPASMGTVPTFAVTTVAARAGPVIARHDLQVIAAHGFGDAPLLDVLIVPGGIVDQPLACLETLDWLRASSSAARVTASVCTGAFLLAKIGLLNGLAATTHWEDISAFAAAYPAVMVQEDVAFVDEGRIVTSSGISAGIAMSLHLVERLAGADLARRVARQMQYDWAPRKS